MIKESYDRYPYTSKSYLRTHPHYLYSVMKILGFDAPNIQKARILEIGCSFGGNILPIAINYPETEIYGIDISEVEVLKGQEIIEYIGLDNIKLISKDILEFNNDLGKFDYIICHGVFSWVPEEVREKILDVISKNLSKNGIAVVSYNAYPGWSKYKIFRDFMKYRVDYLQSKGMKIDFENTISYGRGALNFLKDFSTYPNEYKNDITSILEKDNFYLLHEYQTQCNNPFYLYEFNKMLLKHKLSHVCDSTLNYTFKNSYIEPIEHIKGECEDLLAREQYYDFLFNTQFRTSIITHKENIQKINLSEQFKTQDLNSIYVSGAYKYRDNSWYIGNTKVDVDDNILPKLFEYLASIHPANISIKDLTNKFGDDILHEILALIILGKIDIFPYYNNKTLDGSITINDKVIRYLKKNIEETNVIGIGDYTGRIYTIDDTIKNVIYEIKNVVDDKKIMKILDKLNNYKDEQEKQEMLKNIKLFFAIFGEKNSTNNS